VSDPALASIARAAEEGESYGLSLVTSDGGIFNGYTQRAAAFLERSEEPLIEEAALVIAGGRTRKAVEHVPQARTEVTRRLEAMRAHLDETAGVLTLAPAEWIPQHGQYRLSFPVARIPLSSVSAWWLAGGQVTEEARSGGGSWFVGGIFPVGN
jgi:hypothetical protein